MQALSRGRDEIAPWRDLGRRLEDAAVLLELASGEDDPETYTGEIETDLGNIASHLEELEVQTLLSGPHDRASAILELKPGAGGTEACDWAAMLLRMYLRWA